VPGTGGSAGLAMVSGLLFPVAWVRWYLVDGRLDHKAGP
jgi:hypothetical protein